MIVGIVLTTIIHQSMINLALKFEAASKIMPFTYLPVLVSFGVDILVYELETTKGAVIGSLLVTSSVLIPTLLRTK